MPAAMPWDSDPDYTPTQGAPPIASVAPGDATGDAHPLTIHARTTAPVTPPAASSAMPWDDDPDAPPAGHPWWDTVKDVGLSAAAGLAKGAVGLLTAPETIREAAKNLSDNYFVGPILNHTFGPAPQLAPSMSDLVTGDRPAGGMLHDVATNPGAYIGPAAVQHDLERLTGDWHKPETTAGRYAETVGEFVPGTVFGGVGSALKFGVLPGLASEAAGQVTEGTAAEPWARGIAPILAGGAAAILTRPSAASQVLRGAAGQVDQATLLEAQRLMNVAQAQGTPLTLAEAMQQASNGATMLPALQRGIEASSAGGPTMARFFADRPAQVQQAGNAAIDRIGPVPFEPEATLAPAVQQAAERTIGQAHGARTAATRPLYQAADRDVVPANRVEFILRSLDAQIAADQTGKLAPALRDLRDSLTAQSARAAIPATPATRVPVTGPNGQVIRYNTVPGAPAVPAQARVPVTDVENLSRARKFFRDRMDLPQFADNAIDKETAGRLGPVLDTMDQIMSAASPAYRQANELFGQLSRNVVEPLEAGMVGQLSRSPTFAAQARVILGENPQPGTAQEVGDAVRLIAAQAPDAARALVSQRIRQVFNEATQTNLDGPNQWGGAKFSAAIRGNTQQATNLRAAVEALPGATADTWRNFQNTLDVFEAMGRRLRPGSPTEPLRQFNKALGKGNMIGEAVATGASPAKWLGKAAEIYQGWQYGRNGEALAAMLTRPDAAQALAAIARQPAGSSTAQGMAALYLLSSSANQPGKRVP